MGFGTIGPRCSVGVAAAEDSRGPGAVQGVKVRVIVHHSHQTEGYSEADIFQNRAVLTLIDAQHTIPYHMSLVIEDSIVLTGSFNFIGAAREHIAEDLLVITDPVLAKHYIQNWHADDPH